MKPPGPIPEGSCRTVDRIERQAGLRDVRFAHLVLDLDGTLFNKHRTRTFAQLDTNSAALVAGLMQLDLEQASVVMRSFLQQHGSTLQGLIQSRIEFCTETFLARLHDVDISDIERNHDLRQSLQRLPQDIFVYTNSCHHYAVRMLERPDIHDLVDGIFDIRMAGFVSKPAPASFAAFLSHFRLRAGDCLFVDDSKANLATGKRLGMATIYIDDGGDYAAEDFIDAATTNLAGLLWTLGDSGTEYDVDR